MQDQEIIDKPLAQETANVDNKVKKSPINNMVEMELKTNLKKFFNEIDLVFDYVNKSDVAKLYKFLKELDNSDKLKTFSNTVLEHLKPYEEKISHIVMSKTKIKSNQFVFLNDIILFDNILHFDIFINENKNTKRTIVNYIYNIYMSSFILQTGFSNIQDFTSQINQFVANLKINNEKTENETNEIIEVAFPDSNDLGNSDLGNLGVGNLGLGNLDLGNLVNLLNQNGTNDLGNMFQSLMGNKEIMNLASDLSKDIQNQNLDPMTLLSSLMSGKPNDVIQNLVTNITGKIEEKINNGDIDKNLLEQQANSILSNIKK